ncbi:hypothetical protein BD414DRAFT_418879 [Trametes punicea]|nr:hypothetical protein BD414DRAFT_418879 [Trametes punicea]
MNNGDGRQTNAYPPTELVPFAPNSIVTPEDYRANLERIQQVKAALSFYEEQNQQGLQRYYEQRQALEAAIVQGRLAAERLSQLDGRPATEIFPAPPLPQAGPSTSTTPLAHFPATTPFQPHTPAQSEAELPTSAKIIELPSPHVCHHPRCKGARYKRPFNADDQFRYAQGQQWASQRSHAGFPQQYANTVPVLNGGVANVRSAHPQYPGTAPIASVGTFTHSYEAAAWAQAARSHPQDQSTLFQKRSTSQQAQPSYADATRTAAPQRPPRPPNATAGPSSELSIVHSPKYIYPEAVDLGHSHPSHQSRHGIGAASLDGAVGAAASSGSESVSHAKVTYSSKQAALPKQSLAEPSNTAPPQMQSINPRDEQQLFEFFERLSPATVQRLMVHVLTMVQRKQMGSVMSDAEQELNQGLNPHLQQVCEVISERLKKHSIVELRQLFAKFFNILKTGREQAERLSATTDHVTQAQHPLPTQPSAGASAPTVPNGATSQPAPGPIHPQPATSISAPSAFTHISSTSSTPTADVSTPTTAKGVTGGSLPGPPPQLYQPTDRRMPLARRDAQGFIHYYVPSPTPHSGTNVASSAAQSSSFQAQDAQAQSRTPVRLPGKLGKGRPSSPWTPDKADRRRLAQDIIRSLGRPKGSFGDPLVEQPDTSTPVMTDREEIRNNGKRKPSAEPGVSTPSKRQRTEETEPEPEPEPAPAAVLVEAPVSSAQVIDLTTPTPPEEATSASEPMRTSQDPAAIPSEGAVVDTDTMRTSEEPGDTAMTQPAVERGESVGSSEAADIEKVQAMFADQDVLESVPSRLPSKSASPPREAPDVIDLPPVDAQHFALDDSRAEAVPSADSLPPPPSTEPWRKASVSPARVKVPLFLPSPSSSPGTSSSARGDSQPAPRDDADGLSDEEAAPRPLYGHRWKGKARQLDTDLDSTVETPPASSPSQSSKRGSEVFVMVPPLPAYAKRWKEASPASADAGARPGSSMNTSARDGLLRYNGTFACQWQNCSYRFSDEAKLAQHLRRHAMVPLYCAYEGCDKSFNTPEAFLAHHKSSRHRGGTLRRTPVPFLPAESSRALSPLPEVLPAYMSIPRRVSRHPISKERHQWLGPKVLENITAFKYSGGRSNAAQPERGSRRLAEKVAAAELAGVTPETALAQIKRWIDDEYLSFADGYDASRKSGLRCADIPSQEVTKLLDEGLVLWPPEDDQEVEEKEEARARTGEGPEGREGRDADGCADGDEPQDPPRAASVSGGDDGGAPADGDTTHLAGDGAEIDVDQPVEDVNDGGGGDGHGSASVPSAPAMPSSEAEDEGDAAGGGRVETTQGSTVAVSETQMGEVQAEAQAQATAPSPELGGGPSGTAPVQPSLLQLGDVVKQVEELINSPWPEWPPKPRPAQSAPSHVLFRPHIMQSLPSPGYISARSAEVILSDVRPIKLKLEALQCVNVLLDEFLYSILSVSRSLATDKLKAGLLKVLPTNLGKEALLEAEVELKAYWDRTTSARSSSSARNADGSEFDLQWSFELLRLKCEAYSTMNDSDEDAEAEKRLQQRMEAAGSSSPPNPSLLAPAALYLTAILEAICEHVLSNVSRVAARDSSRTLATVQDLLTALCEDEAIYGTVKTMKVYEQIESLSKAQRPRRSKSFSKSTDKGRTSASSPTPSKARMSTDSTKSNTPTVVGSNESRRTSLEKARAVKIFHSRSLSDREKHEPAVAGALARSQSENGINRECPAEFEASLPQRDDEELQQEFDELMRSGATMKVSLTPDRLKSMEVYKQERTERERGTRRVGQGTEKVVDSSGATPGEPKRGTTANGRPSLRHVDSIVEDDEETGSASNPAQSSSPSAPAFQSNAASARMRNTSFPAAPSPTMVRSNDQRLRSISISNVPHPRHGDGITRKPPATPAVSGTGSQNAMPPPMGLSGAPRRTRKIGRNRESMDLDEVMNGSDGEGGTVNGHSAPSVPSSLRSPTSSRGSDATSPRKPQISRAAQDLIAFLDAGPPEEPAYNTSMNASVISFESSKTRSGRLQRMMSRLTLGGSKESLNGGSIPEEMGGVPRTPRSLSRKNSSKVALSSPPPSFKAASLTSKRSIPDVMGVQPYPNVIVATPPPRPPMQTASSILEPASTTSSTHTSREDVSSQAPSLTRKSTRKAVPALEDSTLSASSSSTQENVQSPANGLRSTINDPDGSTPTSPSPVVRKPIPLNGYPVKIDTSDASLHPRPVTSPTSTADRKSPRNHSKAESGYASRSASRSPVTPSERQLPPPPAPAPAIPPSEIEDLRRLMGAATSADECRLLVDMFLARNGLAPKTVPAAEPPVSRSPAASLDEALTLARRGNDEIERGLVALFLGGGGGHVDSSARLQGERGERAAEHEPGVGSGYGEPLALSVDAPADCDVYAAVGVDGGRPAFVGGRDAPAVAA